MNFEGRLAEELSGWGPRLTLDLERILTRALNDDPKHRFTDATHFRKTLERVLGSASGPVDPSRGDESRRVTIGRSRELSALEDLLRSTASGRPAVLGFRGPRGIGKTKLLDELRLRAQLRGLETVAVSFLDDVPEGSALLEALNSPGPDLGGLEIGRASGRERV